MYQQFEHQASCDAVRKTDASLLQYEQLVVLAWKTNTAALSPLDITDINSTEVDLLLVYCLTHFVAYTFLPCSAEKHLSLLIEWLRFALVSSLTTPLPPLAPGGFPETRPIQ